MKTHFDRRKRIFEIKQGPAQGGRSERTGVSIHEGHRSVSDFSKRGWVGRVSGILRKDVWLKHWV